MTVYQSTGNERRGHTVGIDYSSYRHTGGAGLEIWYWCGATTAFNMGNQTLSANSFYAVPFVAPKRPSRLDRLAWVLTATEVGLARAGIYDTIDSDEFLFPNNLIVDGGEFDLNVSAVAKITTIDVALDPGELYFGVFLTNATPTVRQVSGTTGSLGVWGSTGITTQPHVLNVAFTYAALPAKFPADASNLGSGIGSEAPGIAVRFSA